VNGPEGAIVPLRRFYTTFDAARLLGVSLPTVVNWIKARRLKAHRTPGGHRRIAAEELAAFMVRHGMPIPAELSGAASERRKALVIGASGPGREGAVRQLASAGYAVEQASPGFAAGVAVARFDPDVLVVLAPSPDGAEVVREVALDRELSALPVIGVGRPEGLDALREAGCALALAAPLADAALADAVAGVLERPAGRGGVRETRTRAPRRKRPAD
jgi:excisionase family DNA binding protein